MMSNKFALPSKMPTLSAPKIPTVNLELHSATIFAKGILPSTTKTDPEMEEPDTPLSIPFKIPTLSVPKIPTVELPSATIFAKGILPSTTKTDPEIDEPDTPQKEEPSEKSILKTGHVVYLVMQPVSSAASALSKIRSEMHRYAQGLLDFPALLLLLVAEHWAVMIDDRYYHLKRQTDESLALDLTPFTESAIFLKLPLWKTTFSHEERAGIAVKILASMMDKSNEVSAVGVEQDGRAVGQDGFSFSKYRGYIAFPTSGKGNYNAVLNNCQHFVRRFFNQVYFPNDTRSFIEWPAIALELWFSFNKTAAEKILQSVKSNSLSVEYILESLLKHGVGAATANIPKSAASADEAIIYARDAAVPLQQATSRLVELTEELVPVVRASTEIVLRREKAASEGAGDEDTKGSEKESVNATTYDSERIEEAVKKAIDQLNVLEKEAEEFAELQMQFSRRVKTAKLSVEAYKMSVATASHFNERGDTPK